MGQAPKELNNANIKEAVNKCLQEAPNDGNCPHFAAKSQFGVMKDWDVSKVTNMHELFKGREAFNGNLSEWDTSSLTSAYQMFYSCRLFNSDISNWDVSNVESFQGMFNGNAAFNADISKWNTSKAKTMQGMFKDAINFNQDISDWDTSKVESFVSQFEGADSLTKPLGSGTPALRNGTACKACSNAPSRLLKTCLRSPAKRRHKTKACSPVHLRSTRDSSAPCRTWDRR